MTLERVIIGKQFKEIQVPPESIYNLNPHSTEAREIQPRLIIIYYNNIFKTIFPLFI